MHVNVSGTRYYWIFSLKDGPDATARRTTSKYATNHGWTNVVIRTQDGPGKQESPCVCTPWLVLLIVLAMDTDATMVRNIVEFHWFVQ